MKEEDAPNNSGNAVLSESYKAFTMGFHFEASFTLQLNNLLSFNRSATGVFQDLRTVGIRVISCKICMTVPSTSIGLGMRCK